MKTFDIPLDQESRWEWIKFQLRVRGTCFADLAREHDMNERAIRNAKQRPYPRVERAIAEALDLKPEQLWPERWNADGSPIRQRPNRAEANSVYRKHTGCSPVGHNKTKQDMRDA